MMGRTHRLGGIMVGLGMLSIVPQDPVVIAGSLACSVVGSLFPDLDHKNSTISKKAGVVGGLTSTVFTHRGIMHAPLIYTIVYLMLFSIAPLPYSVFLTSWYFGVLSHLIFDMFNPGGIPLLFPFSKKKFRIMGIPTGSVGEAVFRVVMTFSCVGFALYIAMGQIGVTTFITA